MTKLPLVDLAVLVAYLAGTVALGCWFVFRSRSTDAFMAAGHAMPGWLVGLSVFGTYVSSISFLALPSKAMIADWSYFAFTVSLPLAAWIAVRFFVPFYRSQGEVSAYSHLERRFGAWARIYANTCYLLMQVARTGSVMYLLALPLHQLFGWDVRSIIIVVGVLTTVYTCLGGIEGVIWTDAIQSVILVGGALTCAVLLPFLLPGGPKEMIQVAMAHRKFSLGSFGPSVASATFWVVFAYGLFTNLQNFGIDQTFVQRYHTARTDREAAKSVWMGALLYIPVSAMFFFIGTGLFVFYTSRPDLLPPGLRAEVAAGQGDNVFPYFIVRVLPRGVTGLLIAAIFAGAMSTLSSNLNSAATLTLTDLYKRFVRPAASERESMVVLYSGTVLWGLIGTATAVGLMHVKSLLDAWWTLAGIFSGGMLGLFLLGLIARRAKAPAAAAGVAIGILVIVWMTLSPTNRWPQSLQTFRSPFYALMTIVVGTLAILLVGLFVNAIRGPGVGAGRPLGRPAEALGPAPASRG